MYRLGVQLSERCVAFLRPQVASQGPQEMKEPPMPFHYYMKILSCKPLGHQITQTGRGHAQKGIALGPVCQSYCKLGFLQYFAFNKIRRI